MKKELYKFGESVSIRGIPKILKSNDKVVKIFWLVCVLASTSIVLWQLISLFLTYYSWPSISVYSEGQDLTIPFPDITICSLNPLSKIQSTLTWSDYSLKMAAVFDYYIINSEMGKNLTDAQKLFLREQSTTPTGYILNVPTVSSCPESCPRRISQCVIYNEKFQAIALCDPEKDISTVWNPLYHCCDRISLKNKYINDARGLYLIYYISQMVNGSAFMLPSISGNSGNGIVFFLHNKDDLPNIKQGYMVSAGSETVVNFIPTIRSRLSKPFSVDGCAKVIADDAVTSSRDTCYFHCMQESVLSECGCFAPEYGIDLVQLGDHIMCGNLSLIENNQTKTLINLKKFLCESFSTTYMESSRNCFKNCLFPCSETLYNVEISSAIWPNPIFQYQFYKKYLHDCPNVNANFPQYARLVSQFESGRINDKSMINAFSDLHGISDSFINLKFVKKMLQPYTLSDRPQYTWQSMLSLVGGCLSLWMGVTVMTFIEVVEFFYQLALMCRLRNSPAISIG